LLTPRGRVTRALPPWRKEERWASRSFSASIVLCIDDDVHTLLGYEALLKNHGCNVLVSTSGYQGLQPFQAVPVDAVVLDFQMPGMDGYSVGAKMKQLKPHVPILLLTFLAAVWIS
jgi:CheY-like chemotaxis protein